MLDSTVLTDILGAFVNGTSEGFPLIKSYAEGLFEKLLIIEVFLFGVALALGRIDFKSAIVAKILAIGFVQFLLFRYIWLIDSLRDGFVQAGLAVGGSQLSVSQFLDPSAYISSGLDKVFVVLESRFSDGSWNFLSTFSLVGMFNLFVIILMFFAFVAMGFQIFFAVVEFYIISSLGIIFIPFIVLQKTSFLGSKAINAILSSCIKLMVLAFIASLSVPVLKELAFESSDPTLRESMSLAIGALAVALIMWRAPSIALSFIAGSPALDFNSSLMQPVLSAVTAGAGIRQNVSGAVNKGAAAAYRAAKVGVNYVKNRG